MVEYDVQLYFRRAAAWPLVLGDPASERARLADLLAADGWVPPEPPPSAFRSQVRELVADACTPAVLEGVEAAAPSTTGLCIDDWPTLASSLPAGRPTGVDSRPAAEGVLWDELERVGAPPTGGAPRIWWPGRGPGRRRRPTRRGRPRVLAGEILICLGYSEPDSGSDVAAATTRAERDGDDWVINGQKMFTTLAHEAAYVFLLTRTDPDAPKHRGLTMFLVPMETRDRDSRRCGRSAGNGRTSPTTATCGSPRRRGSARSTAAGT